MPDTPSSPPAVDRAARRCGPRCERARDAAPVGAPHTSHRGRGDAGAMPAVLGQRRQRRLAGKRAVPLRTARLGRRGPWSDIHAAGLTSVATVDPTLPDEARGALMPDTLAIEPHEAPVPKPVGSYSVRAARDSLVAPYRASADGAAARNSRSSRPGHGCSPPAAWRRHRRRHPSAPSCWRWTACRPSTTRWRRRTGPLRRGRREGLRADPAGLRLPRRGRGRVALPGVDARARAAVRFRIAARCARTAGHRVAARAPRDAQPRGRCDRADADHALRLRSGRALRHDPACGLRCRYGPRRPHAPARRQRLLQR